MSQSIRPLPTDEFDFGEAKEQPDRFSNVACFVIDDVDGSHGAPRIPALELAEALDAVPSADVVVFLHRETLAADRRFVSPLLSAFASDQAAVAIRSVPAIDAVKRTDGRLVVEAVDRSTINLLRAPEVIDRQVLRAALTALAATTTPDIDPPTLVNPSVLASTGGGGVQIVEL